MRIAITGGTGTLGRGTVEELRARGHEVRVLSRRAEQYPVDLTTGKVAAAVADVVESEPRRGRVEVAGPEVLDARDLARTWKRLTASRALPVRVPLPGNMGRALRAGSLTTDRADVLGTITYAEWLAAENRAAKPN